METDKILLEAERCVLGTLIDSPRETSLRVEDFYNKAHQIIFGNINSNYLGLISNLTNINMLERVGGEDYLMMLKTYATSSILPYVKIIKAHSKKRTKIKELQEELEAWSKPEFLPPATDESGISDFKCDQEDILDLYENGFGQLESFGYYTLDPHLKARKGDIFVFNASPKSGKTELLASFMLNLQKNFAIFSPENAPTKRYASILFRKMVRAPFHKGFHERMSQEDVINCINEASSMYRFLNIIPAERDINTILEKFQICVDKYGSEGIIIDPFNKIIQEDTTLTEHHWIGITLDKIEYFIKKNNVHCWIAVHPTKLKKQDDGSYPVPTPYDISGSSYWYSKPDALVALKRQEGEVDIHIQDIRWSELGEPGMVTLEFNKINGTFGDKNGY